MNSLKYVRSIFVLLVLLLGCSSHAAAQYTIWPSTATPAVSDVGVNGPIELGVSFKSDVSGYITGIRFYKSANNTGTHLGHLWSSTGTLLATVTFTGESASGWQEASFSKPVPITANTVYVASYWTQGHWSVDWHYFAANGADNPPLHALADGNGAADGVYAYTWEGNTFPTSTFWSGNFWVDVAFSPNSGTPVTAPSITTQPTSKTVTAGQMATFSVVASGSAPMSYQWQKDGTAISGATSASYTTPATTSSDNGAQFRVVVSNSAGSATSSAATLTVSGTSAPGIQLGSSSINFGSDTVGTKTSVSLIVTNSGTANLSISQATVTGSSAFTLNPLSLPMSVAPAQRATVIVNFLPASTGTVSGSLSIASNVVGSPTTVPLSGTGVAAVQHSVALSWNASGSSVSGYNVYRSTVSGGSYSKINSSLISGLSYTDANVQSGTTYYYVTTSVDAAGNESANSNEATAVIP